MALPLNVVVQLELAPPLAVRTHVGPTVGAEPAGCAMIVKFTVPCGGVLVPLATSVTVAVQVTGTFTEFDAGHANVVVVARASLGFSATSCATHSAACAAVAVLLPLAPGVGWVTSDPSVVVFDVALPPAACTWNRSVMPVGGEMPVLLATPKNP